MTRRIFRWFGLVILAAAWASLAWRRHAICLASLSRSLARRHLLRHGRQEPTVPVDEVPGDDHRGQGSSGRSPRDSVGRVDLSVFGNVEGSVRGAVGRQPTERRAIRVRLPWRCRRSRRRPGDWSMVACRRVENQWTMGDLEASATRFCHGRRKVRVGNRPGTARRAGPIHDHATNRRRRARPCWRFNSARPMAG